LAHEEVQVQERLIPEEAKCKCRLLKKLFRVTVISDSDLFQTANGVLPGGSITATIRHTNAQVTYKTHISHTHKYT
jgi:hypothetical protein